jgi:hypothetical protein
VTGVYARIASGREHGFDYLPELTPTFAGWFGEVLGHRAASGKAPAKGGALAVPANGKPATPMPSEEVK